MAEPASAPANGAKAPLDAKLNESEIPGPADGLLVDGAIVIVGPGDREDAAANGTFLALFFSGGGFRVGARVALRDGRYRLRITRGDELGIQALEVGGHLAQPEKNPVAIVDGHAATVRARLERPILLHVVDDRAGAELHGVVVAHASSFDTGFYRHPGRPGDAEIDLRGADSPVELHARFGGVEVLWEQTLFVSAPGFAWAAVDVDFRVGGEQRVVLHPAVDLDVTIAGAIPPLHAPAAGATGEASEGDPDLAPVIRLRQDARVVTEVAPQVDSVTRIESLAPGRYVVALERGQALAKPLVLAQSEVELVTGTASVTLVVKPPTEPRRVHVGGTLEIPAAWGAGEFDLWFQPDRVEGGTAVDRFLLASKELSAVAGAPALHRFDLGEILPGRYLVRGRGIALEQLFETGPEGRDDVKLVVGEPADVSVHLLDDGSGEPLAGSHLLLWTCKRAIEGSGGVLDEAAWDAGTRTWRLRAPVGEIEIQLGSDLDDDFEPLATNSFTVKPGRNEVTIRLKRANLVVMSLDDDGHPVNSERIAWKTTLEPLDGSSPPSGPGFIKEFETFFRAPGPGRYRLVLPPIDGYAAVAPIEVSVRKGERTTQVVKLVKAR